MFVESPVIAVQRLLESLRAEHWLLIVYAVLMLSLLFIASYRLSDARTRADVLDREMQELHLQPAEEPHAPRCPSTSSRPR